MPLDWNQINQDDSSVSGYESTHDDEDLPEPKTIKLLSEAITPKSLSSKSSAQDLVAQNLHKLSLIDSQQVWLFVPKPIKNENTDNFVSLLKSHQKIKKVIPNSAGWNVLVTKKQQAQQLIINGYKKEKLTFKFYVSTKNNSLSNQNASRKGSTESIDESKSFDTPHKLRKLHHEEQTSKKKIKYQEKVSDKKSPLRQKSIEKEVKNQIKQNYSRQPLQNPKIIQKQNFQQRTSELTEIQKKGQQIQTEIKEQNNLNNRIQRQQSEDEQQVKPQMQVSSPEQEDEEQYDSEESLERMRKAIKRKNKKMNKKKGGPKPTEPVDRNNPFSLLT